MGGFAQAVRRQGGLKDFSLGLDKIADILANRKLQQKLLDDQRRKDRQTTAFRNNADSYAGNIKSIYDKSAEDKEITPFESAELNKNLFDFKNSLNQYNLVDPNLRKESSSAMTDLVGSLGKVVTPEKPETVNWKNTEDYFNKNKDFELEKIAKELEADKELAGYKAGLKDKTDKANADRQSKVDFSSLRANAEQGISELVNMRKSLDAAPQKEGEYFLTGNPQNPYMNEESYKMMKSQKEADYKKLFGKYYNDATQMLYKYDSKTNRNLEGAKNQLEKFVNGDVNNIENVLNMFQKDNPDITQDELDVLKINLIYEAMAQ